MTIEEKRQKLKEHCNRMTDCNDCELGGYVTSSCWRYGSDGVIEELYNILTYSTADVTRNISVISDSFICEKCGIRLEDCTRIIFDEDAEDTTYHEYEFKFCPNCGRRIVEE